MKKSWENEFENFEELSEADKKLMYDFEAELNRDPKKPRRDRLEKEKAHEKWGRNERRWN